MHDDRARVSEGVQAGREEVGWARGEHCRRIHCAGDGPELLVEHLSDAREICSPELAEARRHRPTGPLLDAPQELDVQGPLAEGNKRGVVTQPCFEQGLAGTWQPDEHDRERSVGRPWHTVEEVSREPGPCGVGRRCRTTRVVGGAATFELLLAQLIRCNQVLCGAAGVASVIPQLGECQPGHDPSFHGLQRVIEVSFQCLEARVIRLRDGQVLGREGDTRVGRSEPERPHPEVPCFGATPEVI